MGADWNNASTTFSYDADGNVTDTEFPNSTSVTRTFDGADRVTKVVYGFSGGGWPVTYTRGPAGELVGASQLGGANTWAYDPGQQVTATTNPTNAYGFDMTGNPTTLNATAQAFDPSGELCWTGPTSGVCGNPPAGSTTYGYDVNGQRISAGASSFSYDGTGQMQSATTPTGTSSYVYAPDGLRTSKTVGGVTTDFAWDDTTPVPELIQDGDNYYIYGPDGLPVERIGADPTRWLMCDATGSVTVTTDGSASITSVQGYDPWGNPTVTTGTPVSLGWQHQYRDTETGYYNLWHRYYDPTTGQFLSPDPLNALTGSRYGYAGNDPVNGSDPTGLWSYYKHYDLGATGASASQVMAELERAFGAVFPIPGHAATLKRGESMNLHMGPIPFHVRVSRLGRTGWTFQTTAAHVDYPGFISFKFQKDSRCHMHLSVHGNIQGLGELFSDWRLAPINPLALVGHFAYDASSDKLWGDFADNLRGMIRAMNRANALAS